MKLLMGESAAVGLQDANLSGAFFGGCAYNKSSTVEGL